MPPKIHLKSFGAFKKRTCDVSGEFHCDVFQVYGKTPGLTTFLLGIILFVM